MLIEKTFFKFRGNFNDKIFEKFQRHSRIFIRGRDRSAIFLKTLVFLANTRPLYESLGKTHVQSNFDNSLSNGVNQNAFRQIPFEL